MFLLSFNFLQFLLVALLNGETLPPKLLSKTSESIGTSRFSLGSGQVDRDMLIGTHRSGHVHRDKLIWTHRWKQVDLDTSIGTSRLVQFYFLFYLNLFLFYCSKGQLHFHIDHSLVCSISFSDFRFRFTIYCTQISLNNFLSNGNFKRTIFRKSTYPESIPFNLNKLTKFRR